ncbi:sensor histidine kinase, partial [Thermodesulfobacteriota bacterium]
LTGGVSHEFNNILGSIIGYTDMAIDEAASGAETRSYMEQVLKAANRARELVEKLLAFSRKGEQEWQRVHLRQVVTEALQMIRASLPPQVELRESVDVQSDTVLADPVQLHQVLMNICTNSIQATTDAGGWVEVALSEVVLETGQVSDLGPGAYLRLRISDNGTGMDESIRERVFDPFFTTRGRASATGMGLSVAHGIIATHGGTIIVESQPGKGSSFQVYVPRVRDRQEH